MGWEDTNETIMDELKEELHLHLDAIQIPAEFLNVTLTRDDLKQTSKWVVWDSVMSIDEDEEEDDEDERK